MATKTGPAAPVTLSPQRSMRLKQIKTQLGRGAGMTLCVAEISQYVTCGVTAQGLGRSADLAVVNLAWRRPGGQLVDNMPTFSR